MRWRKIGEGADAFGGRRCSPARTRCGLEDDQRDLRRQVVLQVGADLLIGALGVADNALECCSINRVILDFEVILV
jgi:hypothetical protein